MKNRVRYSKHLLQETIDGIDDSKLTKVVAHITENYRNGSKILQMYSYVENYTSSIGLCFMNTPTSSI